jgi:hypothetical protein
MLHIQHQTKQSGLHEAKCIRQWVVAAFSPVFGEQILHYHGKGGRIIPDICIQMCANMAHNQVKWFCQNCLV